MSAIEVVRLHKNVDGRTVLKVDSLHVAVGEIAALVGAADAGLDLLLRLLLGQSAPTAGSIRVAGLDPKGEQGALPIRLGVLFGHDAVYKTRSARANLAFHARLRGLPRPRIDAVLGEVGLGDHADTPAEKLPGGLIRRLGLGIALLHEPMVLVLVDPFARCDNASVSLIGDLLRRYADSGGAVLIMTDTPAYLADLCDAIYRLEQGHIVSRLAPSAEDPPSARPFKIPVRLEGRVALVNPSDILYAAVVEGRTVLQTTAEQLPTQFTLQELEGRLQRSGFFRAHRAYLVNLQHVTEIIPFTRASFTLRLDDAAGTQIPLSRDAARELRELLDF